jgi:hypothetical protein
MEKYISLGELSRVVDALREDNDIYVIEEEKSIEELGDYFGDYDFSTLKGSSVGIYKYYDREVEAYQSFPSNEMYCDYVIKLW